MFMILGVLLHYYCMSKLFQAKVLVSLRGALANALNLYSCQSGWGVFAMVNMPVQQVATCCGLPACMCLGVGPRYSYAIAQASSGTYASRFGAPAFNPPLPLQRAPLLAALRSAFSGPQYTPVTMGLESCAPSTGVNAPCCRAERQPASRCIRPDNMALP